jgi:hypothetical protein
MSLSDRMRPECEAAPWVIAEIKGLETRVKELEADKEVLNHFLEEFRKGYVERGKENVAFQKVIEAARKHKENASHNNYVAMCNALIELDGQSK